MTAFNYDVMSQVYITLKLYAHEYTVLYFYITILFSNIGSWIVESVCESCFTNILALLGVIDISYFYVNLKIDLLTNWQAFWRVYSFWRCFSIKWSSQTSPLKALHLVQVYEQETVNVGTSGLSSDFLKQRDVASHHNCFILIRHLVFWKQRI